MLDSIFTAVKQFIADFYLGDWWIPLMICALIFSVMTFALSFFRKPKPLGFTSWLSLLTAVFGLTGYIEKTRDGLIDSGFPQTLENITAMYKWFVIGVSLITVLNGLGLMISWFRRRHNARRR